MNNAFVSLLANSVRVNNYACVKMINSSFDLLHCGAVTDMVLLVRRGLLKKF